MSTDTNTTTTARYVVRGVDPYERGRMRVTWKTHHVDCPQPRYGDWKPATSAITDLTDCCSHLDDPQGAENP